LTLWYLIAFLFRCDGAGVESKILALWSAKSHTPLKDAADYAAAVMGSEYDNSYAWPFNEINRSISIWEGIKFQYEEDKDAERKSLRMVEKFKLRSRCEIKYSFTADDGGVQYEPGVVLCRDVIGTGNWEVFDVVKRPVSMVMCTPCSNSLTRPVRHQNHPCPLEVAGTNLDAEVDGAIRPGNARIQEIQRGRKYFEALSKETHIVHCRRNSM
jgi:hypothetical protein